MSIFSALGKIIMALVIFGVILGGGLTYLYFEYINPQIQKLSTLDKINHELQERGEQQISYNILNGAISR